MDYGVFLLDSPSVGDSLLSLGSRIEVCFLGIQLELGSPIFFLFIQLFLHLSLPMETSRIGASA